LHHIQSRSNVSNSIDQSQAVPSSTDHIKPQT